MNPTETEPMHATSSPKHSRKQVWIISIIVVAVLAVAGGVIWFIGNRSDTSTEDMPVVSITTNGYSPATIRIKAGQNVQWTNQDNRPHQLQSDVKDVDFKTEEPLNKNDTYNFSFDQKGTFTYHDPLNTAGYKGTIIVE